MSLDPYVTLQVNHDAEDDVIGAAYRALARRYHPDIAGEAATRSMAAINAAYELIGTPERRATYDAERRLGSAGTGMNGGAGQHAGDSSHAARHRGHHAASYMPPVWFTAPDGTGGAGPPPGRPSGTVLPFGRHVGWSIGEVARVDPGYLQWLEERPEGRPYVGEIDSTLRAMGRRGHPPGQGGQHHHAAPKKRFGRRKG
jgi:curved DNA-binding protein CbpA